MSDTFVENSLTGPTQTQIDPRDATPYNNFHPPVQDGPTPLYLDDNAPTPVARYHNAAETMALGVASVGFGLVDVFGSSMPFVKNDAVENLAKGTEFGDFYSNNELN